MTLDWERIRFLYQTDEGGVDQKTWRRGAAALLAALVLFTLIWLALEPYTDHDLAKSPLWVPMTAAAYAYLIFYAFVVMLIAISFVNLSAKRFRDLGRPAPLALAGLTPLLALLAGATHWLQPHVAEVMPRWYVYPLDLALAGVVLWTVYELGFAPAKTQA